MRLTEEQAAAFVRARLGRPPRDPLEVAVTLEAWGGVRPETALALAPRVAQRAVAPDSTPHPPDDDAPRVAGAREALIVVASVPGALALVAALFARLPGPLVGGAWRLALPAALALHGLLRRRSPAEAGGCPLQHERALLGALLGLSCAGVIVTGAAVVGLATVLTAVFAAPPLLAPHRSAWLALLATGTCAAALLSGAPVGPAMALTASAVVLIAAVAPRDGLAAGTGPKPAWRSAWPAGLAGLAFGVLVVSVVTRPPVPPAPSALAAAVPGAAAALLTGTRLRRAWFVLRNRSGRGAAAAPLVWEFGLGGAVVVVTAGTLAGVVGWAEPGELRRFVELTGALSLVALLGTLAGLLDAFRIDVALLAVTIGPALACWSSADLAVVVPATLAGTAVAAVVLAVRLGDPARLLATMP